MSTHHQSTVGAQQRHTRQHPCTVCGGYGTAPRGKGVRCSGFDSGEWARCSREEYAGDLRLNPNSGTFAHRLQGKCDCGAEHSPAPIYSHDSRSERESAHYDYHDEKGDLLYQVVRYEPKSFRQRRPNVSGKWTWSLGDVRRVLYRLPELVSADPGKTVFITEGEKDADKLAALGLTATTCPGGAGKWKDPYSRHLVGRLVVILPDNDEAGAKHARQVARSLQGSAASVKIVSLPGLSDKGDVSDWLAAGGTVELLLELVQEAPLAELQLTGDEPEGEKLTNVRPAQADRVVETVLKADGIELWHDEDGEPWATVRIQGHREHMSVNGKRFLHWVVRQYYAVEGKTPHAGAIADARVVLTSQAIYSGERHDVYIRVAPTDTGICLDLCDDSWRAVIIDENGWRLTDDPPVRFRRGKHMRALPVPEVGGRIEQLRSFVNVDSDEDFLLLCSIVAQSFMPRGPYPVLVLYGQQGSAKSTTARTVRKLVDPSGSLIRATPRNIEDLMIDARNNWMIGLDNLSRLPEWLSDGLCRLSTGGGLAKRELYTNGEGFVIEAQRPVVINGIEELATRGDLLDRAVVLYLPPLTGRKRTEKAFWDDFSAQQPAILGAVLDAVALGIRNAENLKPSWTSRMADFTAFGCAVAPAFGRGAQDFIHAYRGNRSSANDVTLEASAIFEPLRRYVNSWPQGVEEEEVTSADLLQRLGELAGEKSESRIGWPKNAKALSDQLRRLAPNLQEVGIHVVWVQRKKDRRPLVVRRCNSASPASLA